MNPIFAPMAAAEQQRRLLEDTYANNDQSQLIQNSQNQEESKVRED